MTNLRNRIQLIGHLGANPEMKNFDNSKKKAQFSLATTERYQIKDEWKEDTQWHRVIAWDRMADRVEQQLRKGSFVLVEGKLIHRSYEDNNGETQYITEVQAQSFIPLDKSTTEND